MSADKGWVLNRPRGMWELLDHRGELLRAVSAAYVERGGRATVNAHAAQRPRLWPPLRERSYVHLLLAGGEQNGRHMYLDPDAVECPPDTVVYRGQVYRLMPGGPGDGAPAVYRAGEHCG